MQRVAPMLRVGRPMSSPHFWLFCPFRGWDTTFEVALGQSGGSAPRAVNLSAGARPLDSDQRRLVGARGSTSAVTLQVRRERLRRHGVTTSSPKELGRMPSLRARRIGARRRSVPWRCGPEVCLDVPQGHLRRRAGSCPRGLIRSRGGGWRRRRWRRCCCATARTRSMMTMTKSLTEQPVGYVASRAHTNVGRTSSASVSVAGFQHR